MTDQNLTTIPDQTQERWLPIEGFPGYDVSDQGRVRSYWRMVGKGTGNGFEAVSDSKPQTILKPAKNRGGYLYVSLRQNGKSYIRQIHQLVLIAFKGPPPPGHECRHLDGISTHCWAENLQWGTKSENESDKIKHGTVPNCKGVNNSQAKLTESQIIKIRNLYAQGYLQTRIAKIFGIHKSSVNNIIHRRQWSHLS